MRLSLEGLMQVTLERFTVPDDIRDLDLEVVRGKLIDRATKGREVALPPVALSDVETRIPQD